MSSHPARPGVAKPPVPDSVKHPLSMQADYAKPYLYGGTAAIVGILGLVVGAGLLLFGNGTTAAIFLGLGGFLFVAGFLVARYGK